MVMFLKAKGVWGTTGIMIWEKNSSLSLSLWESSHTKVSFCAIIRWWTAFISSGHKKPSLSAWSLIFLHSAVYCPVGLNSGGWGSNSGIFASGSPMIYVSILNSSGEVPSIGLTCLATGSYFLEKTWATSSTQVLCLTLRFPVVLGHSQHPWEFISVTSLFR